MNILLINRNPQCGYSIHKVFANILPHILPKYNIVSLNVTKTKGTLNNVWSNIKQTAIFVRKGDFSICHITGDVHYLTIALLRRKIVVTVHDIGRINNIGRFRRLFYWILRILPLKLATKVVFISEFAKQEVAVYLSLSPEKTIVIPDAVGDEFKYVQKEFNVIKPTILHIGTRPHKNLLRTIEALEAIPCHLRIVGKLSSYDCNLLSMYKIDFSNVCDLSDQELLIEYQNADIVNFPSIHEGFGMPIIESQAVGRVVITSNISPMKEVAGAGACLCNPYSVQSIRNAYLQIISNETYRNNVIECGLRNVMQYRSSVIAQKYIDLYESL